MHQLVTKRPDHSIRVVHQVSVEMQNTVAVDVGAFVIAHCSVLHDDLLYADGFQHVLHPLCRSRILGSAGLLCGGVHLRLLGTLRLRNAVLLFSSTALPVHLCGPQGLCFSFSEL